MAEAAQARRRGHGEDSIYFDATKNRYVGAVSAGWGPGGQRVRRKVRGKTKQEEVRDKLRALHRELDNGVRSTARYSLRRAVEDWLRDGLDGRSQRTTRLYEGLLEPADPEILRDPGDRRSSLTGEPDRALPELRGVGCGHDGHPSRWPPATSGQVSGERGEDQTAFECLCWF